LATDREFTKILDWPGYRVYQHEIDEKAKQNGFVAAKRYCGIPNDAFPTVNTVIQIGNDHFDASYLQSKLQ
jgi:hypothetical protein